MSIGKAILKIVLGTISVCLLVFAGLALYIFVDFSPSPVADKYPTEVINDVTQLNAISVNSVVAPTTVEEIKEAIIASSGQISIGGGRYSQGGQIAIEDSLHFDMRQFNKIVFFSADRQEITVQSGIRWRDVQEFIDPHNLSIKIMQSYANFTVGGSLSVNVHGRYMGEGPIIRSVKSLKLILADGSEVVASPRVNSDIFYGAIGGYGGLGVIVEATLTLAANTKIERVSESMPVSDYLLFFTSQVQADDDVVFHNAVLYPPNYSEVRSVSWLKTNKALTIEERLYDHTGEYWWQPKVTEFVADTRFGKWLRQHALDPLMNTGEVVQWRNREASLNLYELEPASRQETTYVLQEYFVPIGRFDSFVENMSMIFQQYDVNVLNVSIRHALADQGALLAWAREEVFAFVVYYRQGTSEDAKDKVMIWSQALIAAAIAEGGTYYLPYQLHASKDQFHAGYPRANEFFRLKQRVDPQNRFSNKLLEKYYR